MPNLIQRSLENSELYRISHDSAVAYVEELLHKYTESSDLELAGSVAGSPATLNINYPFTLLKYIENTEIDLDYINVLKYNIQENLENVDELASNLYIEHQAVLNDINGEDYIVVLTLDNYKGVIFDDVKHQNAHNNLSYIEVEDGSNTNTVLTDNSTSSITVTNTSSYGKLNNKNEWDSMSSSLFISNSKNEIPVVDINDKFYDRTPELRTTLSDTNSDSIYIIDKEFIYNMYIERDYEVFKSLNIINNSSIYTISFDTSNTLYSVKFDKYINNKLSDDSIRVFNIWNETYVAMLSKDVIDTCKILDATKSPRYIIVPFHDSNSRWDSELSIYNTYDYARVQEQDFIGNLKDGSGPNKSLSAYTILSIIIIWDGTSGVLDPDNPDEPPTDDPYIPPNTDDVIITSGFKDIRLRINPNTWFDIKFVFEEGMGLVDVKGLSESIKFDMLNLVLSGYLLTTQEKVITLEFTQGESKIYLSSYAIPKHII